MISRDVVRFTAIAWKDSRAAPAIRARWGCNLDSLPDDHEGPFIIAGYLGQMAASIALMFSVERIVFGGGVMSDRTLHAHVRAAMSHYLNGYVPALKDPDRLASYICAPALGAQAGIAGALLLAQTAAAERAEPRSPVDRGVA